MYPLLQHLMLHLFLCTTHPVSTNCFGLHLTVLPRIQTFCALIIDFISQHHNTHISFSCADVISLSPAVFIQQRQLSAVQWISTNSLRRSLKQCSVFCTLFYMQVSSAGESLAAIPNFLWSFGKQALLCYLETCVTWPIRVTGMWRGCNVTRREDQSAGHLYVVGHILFCL
jgi:hypothetical protein